MIFSTSTDITRVIEQSEMKVVNIDYCEKNEDLIFFSFFCYFKGIQSRRHTFTFVHKMFMLCTI